MVECKKCGAEMQPAGYSTVNGNTVHDYVCPNCGHIHAEEE